jgi:hypothetical protein
MRGPLDCVQWRGWTAEAAVIAQRLAFAATRADLPVAISAPSAFAVTRAA